MFKLCLDLLSKVVYIIFYNHSADEMKIYSEKSKNYKLHFTKFFLSQNQKLNEAINLLFHPCFG